MTNALIPMMGQPLDFVGSLSRGREARAVEQEYAAQNALRQAYQEHGAGAMRGDVNALAGIAAYDPAAAQGLQAGVQDMDIQRQANTRAQTSLGYEGDRVEIARQEAAMRAQEFAAQADERTLLREREEITTRAAQAQTAYAQGPEAWDRWNDTLEGYENVPFDDAPVVIAKFTGTAQGLETADPTSGMQEYDFARSQGFTGTFEDWKKGPGSSGTNIVNNLGETGPRMGTIPAGMVAVADPNSPAGMRLEAMPGGPAALDAASVAKASEKAMGRRDVATETITGAARAARDATTAPGLLPTTGLGGQIAGNLATTNAAEVRRQTEVLKSIATIENVTAMRNASPSGSALGAVSDFEGRMLAAASGAIDPNADGATYQRQLDNYERTLLQVVHGPEEGERIFKETRTPPGGGDDLDSILDLYR